MTKTAHQPRVALPPPGIGDVEAAVRSVLAEMFRPAVSPSAVKKNATTAEVFPGRLLSLRHVESLDPRVRFVRVAPGTVVTPLARDLLKKRGIEVGWASRSEVEMVGDAGEWALAVDAEGSGLLEAVRRQFLEGSGSWTPLGAPALDAALGWLAETGGRGRGALLLTDEAAAAVYRAAQVAGVRPATAGEPEGVTRAVRSLGINLLAVEPRGKPLSLVRQLGLAFRAGGAPAAPEWVAELGPGFGGPTR